MSNGADDSSVSAPPGRVVTPRPAATVMLVRDGTSGVEVFLMKRSGFGLFGGLHVFPGGKVDAVDHDRAWREITRGPDADQANRVLGLERGGLGHWVACVRECFEEAGVLLARDAQGEPLRLSERSVRDRFGVWRDRLNASEPGVLEAMCHEETLRLATDQLAYVSHWITPVDQPARYDTRFFVARAPAGQQALHDGHETVESAWLNPELALERLARGELAMISPTRTNLEAIAGYATTAALLDAKRRVDPATIPTILPRLVPEAPPAEQEVLEVIARGGRPLGLRAR